ncbi:hypothetical protein Y695_04116 [Hydrogenophaga sp. T4]|nr:hypothetical protein Y695_04116 [Hydrogenophaga sp. T4]
MAQHLHQQPAGVAAGAAFELERFFGRLHARLHADGVRDVALEHLVHVDQEVDGAALLHVHPGEVGLELFGERRGGQVGREFLQLRGVVAEREFFGARLQEKVKGVVHRHLDHQVDRDLELGGGFGEHQAGLVVGKRVLLPVDEVARRFDLLRVRQHLGAAVWRRAQTHHLGTEFDQAVVPIMGDVAQGNMNGHAGVFQQGGINDGTADKRIVIAACCHASKSCATAV